MDPTPATEPVRRYVLTAAALSAVTTFLAAFAILDEITAQTVAGVAGLAVGEFVVIAFGAELARAKAYSPATVAQIEDSHASEVRQVMDAEFVIARAEGGRSDPPVP